MKKKCIAAGCLFILLLLCFVTPNDDIVEVSELGNDTQLVERTSTSLTGKRVLFGINKHGTCVLAPIHQMARHEYLKLLVFYGPNSKVHVFDTTNGNKMMTGRVPASYVDNVWFCLDEDCKNDNFLLMSRSTVSISPYQTRIDTLAVFVVRNGETCFARIK